MLKTCLYTDSSYWPRELCANIVDDLEGMDMLFEVNIILRSFFTLKNVDLKLPLCLNVML